MQLTEAHKSNYVTRLVQESDQRQAIVHDQPKAVQRKMSAAFETMDKEVHFIQYRYYLTYLTTVDLFVCEPRN